MKKNLLILILTTTAVYSFAQKDSIETLKHKLSSVSIDSLKIKWTVDLGEQYEFIKPDSAIHYFRLALIIANRNNFKRQALICNQQIARFMWDNGNYMEALRLSNQTIEQAKELKDTIRMFYSVRLVLWLYMDLGSDHSMEYADRLLLLTNSGAINKSPNAAGFNEMANRYKADIFKSTHQDDSAFFYYSRALNYAKKSADPLYLGLSSEAIGKFYFEQENYDSAFYYYRLTVPIAIQNLRTDIKMHTQLGMANIFLVKKQLDSAFLYASTVFKDAGSLPDSSIMQEASSMLSTIYKKQGNVDSAYKYLEYSVTLDNLLVDQEKQKNVREVLFKQTLQQQQEEQQRKQAEQEFKNNIKIYTLTGGLALLFLVAFLLYRNSRQKQKDAIKIQEAYNELKATQSQLIQSEKMASLGELTAGIAHEIQNPLNFVNNFAEINTELVDELKEELSKGKLDEAKLISEDLKDNNQKIAFHGRRADSIVKGMLQHSRTSTGKKELADINALADEFLRLSYHGLRAKDKSFNATMETSFDYNIDKVEIIPQDLGRVLLNLFNNAFYSVNEKKKNLNGLYEPKVFVSTEKLHGKIEITVKDNGNGISQKIIDKIYHPFFTTKPTGDGTGLGLSLSYDIITKGHNGELKVETKEGEFASFKIILPA